MSVEFKGFLSMYGAGFFPRKQEPEREIRIRTSIRFENIIKKQIRVAKIMKR